MARVLSPLSGAAPTGFLIKPAGVEIALGQVEGISSISLAAQTGATGAAEIDVWPETAIMVLPVLTGSPLEVLSTDPADTVAGTGARTVTLTLLDTDFVRTTQTVDMNGATAVILTGGPWVMCESMIVTKFGTGVTNAGIIRCRISVAGAVQSHMPAGAFMSAETSFGVATDEQAVIQSLDAGDNTITANPEVQFRTDGPGPASAAHGSGIIGPFQIGRRNSIFSSPTGFVISSKSRVRLTCNHSAGAANITSATVGVVRVANTLTD